MGCRGETPANVPNVPNVPVPRLDSKAAPVLPFSLRRHAQEAGQRKGRSPMNRKLRANLMLLTTAFIWGIAFVAQDVAMKTMQPFTFNGIRMIVAGFALILCIRLLGRREKKRGQAQGETQAVKPTPAEARTQRRTLLLGGVCCGGMLFFASNLQQFGIDQTSAGKAGFVTALYIVLVPLTGLFAGKRLRPLVWLGVAFCTLGMFLLCVTGQMTIAAGDVYLFLCAVGFTGHILVIDHFSPKVDCVKMSCIQFFVSGALSLLCMAFFEQPTAAGIARGVVPILFTGVFSGAMGYTLQMLAQRDTDPTIASLLMCLESVFAVLAGWVLLGDLLTPRELLGCTAMMAGIVLAQWPERRVAETGVGMGTGGR